MKHLLLTSLFLFGTLGSVLFASPELKAKEPTDKALANCEHKHISCVEDCQYHNARGKRYYCYRACGERFNTCLAEAQ